MPIPLRGDRSAWDATDYPGLHASDLDEYLPKYHLPFTSGSGKMPYYDGDKWVSTDYSLNAQFSWIIGGEVEVSSGTAKVPNRTGRSRTVVQVWLDITTSPTGSAIIVDILKNGTTIFSDTDNRPQIAAGQEYGYTENIDIDTWDDGDYYTWQVVQVGSTDPGADLTITVVYR